MAAIRERDGKFQARVNVKGVGAVAKTFASRADALAWSKVVESEMIRGAYIKRDDSERTTLGEALARYEREVTATKRGKAAEAIRIATWRRHKLAQKSLASLRGADFAKFRDERLAESIAPATISRDLSIISHVFTIASKEWGFEGLANPVRSVRLPAIHNSRTRLFHADEEKRLLDACASCSNPWVKPLVELALATACRRGELLALQWENVRLASQVIDLPLTKNGSSRSVPLSTKAVEVLQSIPQALRGPVFPITANALRLSFVRAVARAKRRYVKECKAQGVAVDGRVLSDLHLHDLRHVAVTRLAEKLPNVIELASVSGHKDVRMLRRYYHPKAADLALKLG